MGLDGISVNQLRISPERSSAELNSTVGMPLNETRIVDGLSNGQRVDPKNEHENDNTSFEFKKKKNSEEEEEHEESEEVTKYDLSDSNKYTVTLNEAQDKIIISEKATGNVIQQIDAETLLELVEFSPNSCGAIISKKL